jgi:PKD repeat protein
MKKLLYFFGLLWCCAYLSPLQAQPDSLHCNAYFNYNVNGHTVKLNPWPDLPAGTMHWWTFGDAGNSTQASPTHTYANAGTYRVTHFILNQAANCKDSFVRSVTITDSVVCNFEVKFEFRRDSLNPLKVFFFNNTVAPGNAQYLWTFGDGSSSTDKNPVHTYAAPGAYKVCLKVFISNTCVRDACKEINLQPPPPPPACNVQAKFVWRKDSLQWNKIWFANLTQPVQNIWRTAWSYGDGTASQDFNSFHVYQQPGKYYVCLKVQSLNGCISTYCDSVIVRKPLNCDTVKVKFEYTPNQEKPYIISFRAVSNTPVVQQSWTITKVSNVPVFPPPVPVVINASNPTYTFQDSGWYMVCLYAVTANNCKKSSCERIYIQHGQNGRTYTGRIPVYPNPANTLVRLELELESAALLQVRVLDGAGTPKMKFVSPGRAGNNNIAIPVEKLGSGMYVVEIRYGNQLKLAKFQKS